MRAEMRGKYRFVLITMLMASTVWLGACVDVGVNETAAPDQQAERLMSQRRFHDAAQEWLRVAAAAGDASALTHRAAAANAFLLAGDAGSARKALAGIPAAGMPPAAAALAALARARLASMDGRRDEALQLLPPAASVPVQFERVHVDTRVAALAGTDRHVDRARAYADLGRFLADAPSRTRNDDQIWSALSNASDESLQSATAPPPDVFGGWVELARLGRQYRADAEALNNAIALWNARYPGHPGSLAIAPRLVDSAARLSRPASHVALMLPLSGRLARAGAAVRDGFLGAWLSSGIGSNVRLSIIDTNGKDAAVLYQSALAGGVDFFVGPLRKEAVAQITAQAELPVPTLVLNAMPIPEPPRPTLYQMALAPEQEAAQVARKIWFDGHQRVLIAGPASDWGHRVVEAFSNAFLELGGYVLETQLYDAESRDLSEPVKRLLNIDLSEERARALRRLVRADVDFEARRRQDVDAIFMAGFGPQARALRPQLRFHRASDVPVYSTSHVYGGVPLPDRDRDIDGVMFGDMPWVLNPPEQADPLKAALSAQWGNAMAGFARLFAFGADAQALVTRLSHLRSQPGSEYTGHTGTLSVSADNVVTRRLTWARFTDGVPQLVDTQIPASQGGTGQ